MYVEAIASVDGGSTRRLSPPVVLEDSEDVPQQHRAVRRTHAAGAGARRRNERRRLYAGRLREGLPAAVRDGAADRVAQRSHRRALRRTSLAHGCVHRAARRSAESARVTSGHFDRKRPPVCRPAGDARRLPDVVRQRERRSIPYHRGRRVDSGKPDARANSRIRHDRCAAERLPRSARSRVLEEGSRAGTDVAAR